MATPSPAKKARTESRHGPEFVRNAVLKLDEICTSDPITGWRDPSEARVAALKTEFLAGNFGMTVACGVTILEKEGSDGKKLIDDGVSTVMALLACRAFFAGEPERLPPSNLKDIFELGLHVRVVKYSDDDDREARECWNIARHDEEHFTVRWSSLAQKIGMSLTYFRRYGTWTAAAQAMVDFYGDGKKTTVGRWTRAAKGMDVETVELLKQFPDMKGSFLWDNSYLVASATRARDKMSAKFAGRALELLAEHSQEISASAFVSTVCKPMRVVEVWQTLMIKRYGSVASLSPAMERLVQRLCSWGGLGNVRSCMDAGVVLHDPKGIPECGLLAGEFDKCKAGGLPPPVRIPTEASAKAAEQAAAAAAAAAAAHQEEQKELERQRQAETEREQSEAAYATEADLWLMTAAEATKVGSGSQPTRSAEEIAAETVSSKMKNVHFFDPVESFVSSLAEQKLTRGICLVEAPTTNATSFGHLLEVAAQAFQTLRTSHEGHTGSELVKFRMVVLIGSRFDLIAKTFEKLSKLFPAWSTIVVQLQRRERQSDRARPSYAVVSAPAGELTATEPTVITLPRSSAKESSRIGIGMRCTESGCLFRPEAARANISDEAHEDASCEIDKDDKVNLLEAMLDDAEDGGQEGDGEDDQLGGTEHSKRDAIVDLWPYAREMAYYTEVLTLLGAALKSDTALVLSTTAHPAHWLACERLGLKTWVLTRRWSEHSRGHGEALGKAILLQEAMPAKVCPAVPDDRPIQFISAAVKSGREEQVIEAYDVVQGGEWNDGVNRSIPKQIIDPGSQAFVRKEADIHQLRVTPVVPDKGRGIETVVSKREGEIVCEASALFFDDFDVVMGLIKANPRFGDRVCRIEGVHRAGEKVVVYAVLVGIAQFIQHYTGYRTRHNAILEFDPSLGFNSGCLKVVASTRTGVGIAAGSPVLLNYGADYDFQNPPPSDESYYGALDALFDSQRKLLPEARAENQRRAAEEEAAKAKKADEERIALAAAAQVEAKKKEEEARAVAAKLKAEEEEKKRAALAEAAAKAEAEKAAGAATVKDTFVSAVNGHPCNLVLCDGKLRLRSTAQTNKRVPADTVLAAWSNNSTLSTRVADGIDYNLTFKSDVVDSQTMKRTKLDKYVKDRIQQTTEIFGYEPFPAGSTPKVLSKKGGKTLKWEYTGPDKNVVKAALDAARTSTTLLISWMVKHEPSKTRVEPCGMCLVLPKGVALPGGGTWDL